MFICIYISNILYKVCVLWLLLASMFRNRVMDQVTMQLKENPISVSFAGRHSLSSDTLSAACLCLQHERNKINHINESQISHTCQDTSLKAIPGQIIFFEYGTDLCGNTNVTGMARIALVRGHNFHKSPLIFMWAPGFFHTAHHTAKKKKCILHYHSFVICQWATCFLAEMSVLLHHFS